MNIQRRGFFGALVAFIMQPAPSQEEGYWKCMECGSRLILQQGPSCDCSACGATVEYTGWRSPKMFRAHQLYLDELHQLQDKNIEAERRMRVGL